MDHSKKLGIMFAVALLVLSLTVPAAAKRGGEPGPPTGSDLDVTVTTGSFAWANSAGDIIRFEIIVTNKGSEEMIVDSVKFDGKVVAPPITLAKNASWTMDYPYSVPEADLEGLPVQESTDVSKTVAVTATVGTTTLEESAAASFTAHPIEPCRESGEEPFVVGPHSEYTVCSDAFSDANYWKLETTGTKPQGKHKTPFVTMRDGVPGNWCMVIPGYDDKQTGWATSTGGVHFLYFPDDGTCLGGGAGGDPIQTRNSTLFYLAYRGDSVEATPCPGGVLLGADNKLVCLDAP